MLQVKKVMFSEDSNMYKELIVKPDDISTTWRRPVVQSRLERHSVSQPGYNWTYFTIVMQCIVSISDKKLLFLLGFCFGKKTREVV